MQEIRACFDLMAYDTEADWETVARRMAGVPAALQSFESALREGMSRGTVSARRQALGCAQQAAQAADADSPAVQL